MAVGDQLATIARRIANLETRLNRMERDSVESTVRVPLVKVPTDTSYVFSPIHKDNWDHDDYYSLQWWRTSAASAGEINLIRFHCLLPQVVGRKVQLVTQMKWDWWTGSRPAQDATGFCQRLNLWWTSLDDQSLEGVGGTSGRAGTLDMEDYRTKERMLWMGKYPDREPRMIKWDLWGVSRGVLQVMLGVDEQNNLPGTKWDQYTYIMEPPWIEVSIA